MDTDDLKRITNNPDFVPGINNYCDRWCERCSHTTRCSVYAIEQEELLEEEPETGDDQQITLNKLQAMLRLTMGMIREQAEETGVNLETVSEADKAEMRSPHEKAKQHPCVQQAEAYRNAVGDWLDRVKPILQDKQEELSTKVKLNLPDHEAQGEYEAIKEALAVIQWYFMFIGVKLVRTATTIHSQDPDQAEYEREHTLGTAKVALISMDRSLAAWNQLREYLPDEADTILDFLVQLERLRKATETWQPESRVFQRPGLDG